MITGFTLFKYDKAVKLHFTNKKYNLFDHKGKANGTSFESFLARRDYNLFNAIARKFETDAESIQFLVANYAYKNSPIYNIASSDNNFITWTKRKQSITNTFKNDIDNMILVMEKKSLSCDEMLDNSNDIPELFKMYLGGSITVESLFILNKFVPFVDKWETTLESVWGKDLLIVKKLDRFVKFNDDTIKKYLENTLLYTESIV
tara:strand:- start:705 stop:1316 length:612 start_codon:yes stop_codon:yes gene_type:complete